MKKLIALFVAVMLVAVPAFASTEDHQHTVEFRVDPALDITSSTGTFTLTMADFISGSESNVQPVTYNIRANKMPAGALSGAVYASMDQLVSDVDLKASFVSYSNVGSSGNAVLSSALTGYEVVGTSAKNLAHKDTQTGNQAKIVRGNLVINWKALANKDLADDLDQDRILTVTIKDA